MSEKAKKEIFKLLAYFDIFNYPLTAVQIQKFLGTKITGKKLLKNLSKIPHALIRGKIYYFLPGRNEVVVKRLKKSNYSWERLEKVRKISKILGLIPSVRFIGVSGSTAMGNAQKSSDIDLFFVCAPHTTWITRFLVYSILSSLGQLRKRKGTQTNTICANMFVDNRVISWNRKKRNIYTAHEIIQLLPLINKSQVYEEFLHANAWVSNYFPNFLFPKRIKKHNSISFWSFLAPVEYVFYKAQLFYMRSHKTREITTPTFIAFHPINYEKIILEKYQERIENLNQII